jgi:hypothetical protein
MCTSHLLDRRNKHIVRRHGWRRGTRVSIESMDDEAL